MAEKRARYVVGIDLGTTNTVVGFVDTAVEGEPRVELFEVDQLVAVGQVAPRPMLPSMRYHAAPGELPDDQLRLPWSRRDEAAEPVVVGELARELGGRVPGRLVASAKSWLVHPDVDRTAPILPWGAADDVGRVSPVDASASYLAHLRAAWDDRFAGEPLAQQDVVLTVPASFDDRARQLTVTAAQKAGLPRVRLIEEPQAAMYDWLWRHRGETGTRLAGLRLALVCDVGGGTSDFSLVRIDPREGGPKLTRTAVGDHLVLGGDNMDLALARAVESRLGGAPLGAGQLSALVQQCRGAKERLLGDDAPVRTTVAVLGSGSRLVGGTRSAELARDEVVQLVVDGFFPAVAPGEAPARRQAAIREFGLPYVADPAVTRHLAAFLARHADASREALGTDDAIPVPDAVLLNGGVFRAPALARRLVDVLAGWRGAPLAVLDNDEPELAVARGAAAYGLARRGVGAKIGGGSARAYFVVVEGRRAGSREAVCLVPRGTEEGEEITLPGRTFALRLGRPVLFHLTSSTTSHYHRAGELVPYDEGAYDALPPVAAVLERAGGAEKGEGERQVTVGLAGHLTEIGTLELHCVAADDPRRRWALEFQVRGEAAAAAPGAAPAVVTELHPRLPAARDRVQRVFSGARGAAAESGREIKALRRELEALLGARETWSLAVSRELFGALWAGAKRRRRSADHERVWLNLAGWTLRPGHGYPLDEWRAKEAWSLWPESVQYGKEARVWSEWWTFWRRIAGGLEAAAQEEVFARIAPHLGGSANVVKGQSGLGATRDEMLRLAGSLERVDPGRKAALGERLLTYAGAGIGRLALWVVGRLGARAPIHGSAHAVVARRTAETWLTRLLALDWAHAEGAAFAAVLIARRTGDRERDVSDAARADVLARLAAGGFPAHWHRLVRDVAALDEDERRLAFGDSLPPGLRLVD